MIIGLLNSLFGFAQKRVLTEKELQLCLSISYDTSIAKIIKAATNAETIALPSIDEYGDVIDTAGDGLCSRISEKEGFDFVFKHKEDFRQKGYLLFVFEDDNQAKYLATIKGNNELDIVKWRKTNGINYDITNRNVISKLKSWKAKYDFAVLGVGLDWLQFTFIGTRPQFDKFAKEVYKFCPDIVDQGTGDIPTLISELKRMDGVFLWWD